MAYIIPNSTIYICDGVPLDESYQHTLFWSSAADQQTYFAGRVRYTENSYSYIRHTLPRIKVNRSADDLFGCNYLCFRNTNFGNKWFYAFITEIEYINNETAQITFKIDAFQTFFFDYTLDACFVEREHSATDNVGDNLIPENLDYGQYIHDTPTRTGFLQTKSVIVAASFDRSYQVTPGIKLAGLQSGLAYTDFDDGDTLSLAAFITGSGAQQGNIVSIFYYPTAMLPSGSTAQELAQPVYKNLQKPLKQSGALVGNFVPKNKKLYTYPYNFLYVTNSQGNSAEYRYEFFDKSVLNPWAGSAPFVLCGDFSPNPTFWLYPQYYKGSNPVVTYNLTDGNFNEGLSIGGWGQIPYVTDAYKAWLAQSGSSLITNALSSTLAGGMHGGAAGAAAGFVSSAGTAVIQRTVQSAVETFNPTAAMPKQAHGSFSPMSQLALGILDFWFYPMHITEEYAHIIDEYFTRFGYACHRIKTPNISARPRWNYVKTVGCTITSSRDSANKRGIPADAEREICNAFDNGITFWKTPDAVGQYSANNDPV